MKTLSINIELSQLALETASKSILPIDFLNRAKLALSGKISQLGGFINCQLCEQRSIGSDLNLEAYDLQYEHRTLRLKFVRFQPRGTWEMQGFQWVA
jgi:hypothetical protein